MIDFQDFTLPASPNSYYVAPEDFSAVTPQEISPIYNVDVDTLSIAWHAVIKRQPRITELEQKAFQFSYIQRTKWLNFPDYIDVKLIPSSSTQSTIAIFSRSKYGYYDFGTNQQRVQSWLAQLNQEIDDKNTVSYKFIYDELNQNK